MEFVDDTVGVKNPEANDDKELERVLEGERRGDMDSVGVNDLPGEGLAV